MSVCVSSVSQFLVSLLPTLPAVSEKSVSIAADTSPDVSRASPPAATSSDQFDASGSPVVFRIRLRNVLLGIILRLTTGGSSSASSSPHGGATINTQSVLSHILATPFFDIWQLGLVISYKDI